MATVSHYDHATGQSVTRKMNAEEQAIYDAELAEAEAQAEAQAEKQAARQAVLDKLGLTADEAAALFG